MKYGDQVMILGHWIGPRDTDRVDAGGRWWGSWPGNSRNAGKARIMCDGAEIAVDFDRVLPYTRYFEMKKLGILPPQAAGKPWFLEGA